MTHKREDAMTLGIILAVVLAIILVTASLSSGDGPGAFAFNPEYDEGPTSR